MQKEYQAPLAEFMILNTADMLTLSGGAASGGATDGDWFIDGGMLG